MAFLRLTAACVPQKEARPMPIPLSEPDGATSTAGVAGAAPVVSLLSQKVKAGNEHVKGTAKRSEMHDMFVDMIVGGFAYCIEL